MAYWSLFFRLIVRPVLRERARSVLVVFAVGLGVSVVLAIDLAGNAAAGSFRSSMETLAGDDDLEVTAAGGVPEQVVGQLATLPYPLRVTPRIEDHATVSSTGVTVALFGIDVIAEANRQQGRNLVIPKDRDSFQHINDRDAIWTTRGLGYRLGEAITLLVNDERRDYVVRGFVPESAQDSEDVVLMDLAAAQNATHKLGRVDRILLKVPEHPGLAVWQQKLRDVLPSGVALNPEGSQTAANRRMLSAFRWNLRILSYIALLVGAFLIYNTISVSVVRRRADIGTVRALGASRRAVLLAFLAEAAMFGLVGALIALPMGRLMATGAVRLLATTVNALYITSRPGALNLSAESVILALIVGVGVAVMSALAPAREASLVPPTEAMARGLREYTIRVERTRDAGIALVLAIAGALAARLPAVGGKPIFGYLSALLLIGASSLSIPALVYWITSVASTTLRRFMGVEAMLASRSLAGSLRRTSVLVGALSTAIAMMTSVGIMVGSFRQTVITWMDSQLPADLYLRPAGDPSMDRHPTISVDLTDRIANLPGVQSVSRFRAYEIEYQGLPVTLGSADTHESRYYRSSGFLSGRPATDVLQELLSGDSAIVSEPFANKHGVKAGDFVALPLGERVVRFRVVDVFYDYANERGYVIVDRSTMLRYLPDPSASNLAVYLAPGVNLETTRKEIEQAAANNEVLIFSNRDIRREAIRIFDQTFAITYALEAVAVLVAVMGIAGALMSIVIDRRREFGLLRFLGAATSQVRKLILVEAGLIGLLANLAGLMLGAVLSLVLIFVINKQSFGWTIQFHWPVKLLLAALSLVYLATIVAGIYPARVAQRLNPIEVVHEE
ncbi:MAG TPA: FtsX-like permease family protein [Candidatus Sulfotelmatobacter sp.]|nr:FtsX-like permease family protein [Candidatus Sulfotelmatobacter sp.]